MSEVVEVIARRKIVSDPDFVLSQIRDGDVVAISGFNEITSPDYLVERLYRLYVKTGHPKNLFIISDTFPGSPGRGLDRVAQMIYQRGDRDFIRGALLAYYGWSETLQKMVKEEWFEAYAWSIGILAYWFREVGSGRPGVLTRVGLGTTADPRQDGTALNEMAKEKRAVRVQLLDINGKEYLLYTAPKPRFALIRGSTADEIGNLSLEDEAAYGTVLNIAQATKAMPEKGTVIAQVLRIAKYGSLNPKLVVVPGPLVDHVIVAPREYHWQTHSYDYDPIVAGRVVPALERSTSDIPLNERKVIARRVALELANLVKRFGRPVVVNLGVGIPAMVGEVAVEEEVQDLMVLTVESGTWGGRPLYGPDFGVSLGAFAVISVPDQFTMYEGGVIDAASLGFMQVDREGNVNSFYTETRMPGPGGFPAIAAGSPEIYYAGLFTAGKGVKYEVGGGRLKILSDGDILKFVNKVYKIGCSSKVMLGQGKRVLYITERAVFTLTPEGLELSEVAPGVDIEKDVLSKMEFKPVIRREPELMDKRIFEHRRIGLKEELVRAIRA
ncbi:MAG: acyl CoA:acetate/3-ketoacid CoA transferase [Acidilobus sp.]